MKQELSGWKTAVYKRLKLDFQYVSYQCLPDGRYSTKLLRVGQDEKDCIVITMEDRSEWTMRDVEMLRDSCLILYYRQRWHPNENILNGR